MRIVIKPGGVIVILSLISTVSVLGFRSSKTSPPKTTPANPPLSRPEPLLIIPLLENGDFSKELTGHWNFANAVPSLVKEKSPDGTQQYLRLNVVPGTDSWHVNMGQRNKKPLKTGDNVMFHGWFRSPESLVIHFYLEETATPHGKTVSKQIYMTPEWKEVYVTGIINRDYAPGDAQLMIHFGVKPGTVEMAGFQMENYGSSPPPLPPSPAPSFPTTSSVAKESIP